MPTYQRNYAPPGFALPRCNVTATHGLFAACDLQPLQWGRTMRAAMVPNHFTRMGEVALPKLVPVHRNGSVKQCASIVEATISHLADLGFCELGANVDGVPLANLAIPGAVLWVRRVPGCALGVVVYMHTGSQRNRTMHAWVTDEVPPLGVVALLPAMQAAYERQQIEVNGWQPQPQD